MQQTRQYILEILRDCREATVDDLVRELKSRIKHDITAVTVRHHLDILRGEDLVTAPNVRHRNTPGRPQYVYALTERALEQFPNNYQVLAAGLLNQIKVKLSPAQVNVILEGVADEMISNAQPAHASLGSLPLEARLDHVVEYLTRHGYEATWEQCPEGYTLYTHNCPYQGVTGDHGELCTLDFRLISGLLGIVPRNLGRIVQNAEACSFLIPAPQGARSGA
jgi:predicted ArsR family transcriptional regulator